MASGEFGNYHQRRFEGMINLPIVDDRFDIRIAGEWTKRQGYSFNKTTDQRIDGRDLWSGRVSIGSKPFQNFRPLSSGNISRKTTTASGPVSSFVKRPRFPDSVGGVPVPPRWIGY